MSRKRLSVNKMKNRFPNITTDKLKEILFINCRRMGNTTILVNIVHEILIREMFNNKNQVK